MKLGSGIGGKGIRCDDGLEEGAAGPSRALGLPTRSPRPPSTSGRRPLQEAPAEHTWGFPSADSAVMSGAE